MAKGKVVCLRNPPSIAAIMKDLQKQVADINEQITLVNEMISSKNFQQKIKAYKTEIVAIVKKIEVMQESSLQLLGYPDCEEENEKEQTLFYGCVEFEKDARYEHGFFRKKGGQVPGDFECLPVGVWVSKNLAECNADENCAAFFVSNSKNYTEKEKCCETP